MPYTPKSGQTCWADMMEEDGCGNAQKKVPFQCAAKNGASLRGPSVEDEEAYYVYQKGTFLEVGDEAKKALQQDGLPRSFSDSEIAAKAKAAAALALESNSHGDEAGTHNAMAGESQQQQQFSGLVYWSDCSWEERSQSGTSLTGSTYSALSGTSTPRLGLGGFGTDDSPSNHAGEYLSPSYGVAGADSYVSNSGSFLTLHQLKGGGENNNHDYHVHQEHDIIPPLSPAGSTENEKGGSVDQAELERLLPLIPLHPETGEISSAGSIGHGTEGQCNPCGYVRSRFGCANGARCTFCHMPHPKRRPKGQRNGSSKRGPGASSVSTCCSQTPSQMSGEDNHHTMISGAALMMHPAQQRGSQVDCGGFDNMLGGDNQPPLGTTDMLTAEERFMRIYGGSFQ